MKKITAWTKVENVKDKEGTIVGESKHFNHISDDWSDLDYPTPSQDEYVNQKAWENMKWEKKHAYLDENFVVVYPV